MSGKMGNGNLSDALIPGDLDRMQATISGHVAGIIEALGIDADADHNMRGTADRVAKMYVREIFAGRFEPRPKLTDFPNVENLDQLYTVGPITIRSCCSHHLCPIEGEAWCGVIPSDRVIGLSKFTRIANWVMARPQIQEEATVQLADEIENAIHPLGLGVVVRAHHSCMGWRGVRDRSTTMATSVLRGALREKPEARAEFLAMIKGQSF